MTGDGDDADDDVRNGFSSFEDEWRLVERNACVVYQKEQNRGLCNNYSLHYGPYIAHRDRKIITRTISDRFTSSVGDVEF